MIIYRNKIVEIKSEYTLDLQNMLDKKNEYKRWGYEFELYVDKKLKLI